ncbi:DUF2569 domain-containing protein [Candidatus Clostridium stratigraminis]|uniref:DUF2569 domain-containing protein n=1 Tax=Candidatus Clostridium stratigraminis TaxID=3381661 RepID=A0ABW8T0Z3_9CLOT
MGEINSNQCSEPKLEETIITEESNNKYDKIGGWLILVAIGLCISIVLNLPTFIKTINSINSKAWPLLTTIGTKYYQAGLKEAIYFEIIGFFIILITNLLCIIFFFKKKRLFPKLMISLLTFNLIFQITQHIIVISNTSFNANSTLTNLQLAKPFITALVWIPYFILSERVKKTFIK